MQPTKAVKRLVQSTLGHTGHVVVPGLGRLLRAATKNGIQIQVVYDIGAHVGDWTRAVQPFLPATTQFVLFEANHEHSTKLKAAGHQVYSVTLGRHKGEADFFSSGGTGDSMFRENTHHYDSVKAKRTSIVSLDQVIEDFSIPLPDFIKIDTQGSEIEVMMGAGKALENASLLLLEVPVLKYNIGAPGFETYIQAASDADFVPISVVETHIGHGTLMQIDILFASMDSLGLLGGDEAFQWASRLLQR
jgi:FkbM family methyltransferase